MLASERENSETIRPILSVCVPTFNRSDFLRVMLSALVPQAQQLNGLVEVVVLDNASTDGTADLLTQYQATSDLHVHRQDKNVGPTRNIVDGPAKLARGQFVWVLGDHNLLLPNALKTVVSRLKQDARLDVFYANFRCATWPEHWPDSAAGGHDGPFLYVGNPDVHTDSADHWYQVLNAKSVFGTQNYAHIVRTEIWANFWKETACQGDYSSGINTYPHTWMLVNTCLHKPAGVFPEPLITIFNGAQSWNNIDTQSKVYLNGLPDLIQTLCELRGDSSQTLLVHLRTPWLFQHLTELIRQLGKAQGFPAMLIALHHSHLPLTFRKRLLLQLWWEHPWNLFRITHSAGQRFWQGRFKSWWWNCRPARWLRTRRTR